MTLTVPGDTRDGSLQGVLATLQSANSPQEIHLRPTTAIDDRSPRLGVCAGQRHFSIVRNARATPSGHAGSDHCGGAD